MKAALILSGCGVYDGAEVSEVVLLLTALESADIEFSAFAPNKRAFLTYHYGEKRVQKDGELLVDQAARITRKAYPLEELDPQLFDFLIIPGGFGVVQNLFLLDFQKHQIDPALFHLSYDLKEPSLLPEVDRVVKAFYKAKKPILACCLGPLVIAKALEGLGIQLTFGHEKSFEPLLKEMGQIFIECDGDQIVVDEKSQVITTPAFFAAKKRPEMLLAFGKAVALIKKGF